jgi:hypothetical protein
VALNLKLSLLVLATVLTVSGCSSETLGYVDKAKFDNSQKEIADLKKQVTDVQDKLATSQKSAAECQAHKYQMFQSGYRTWRLDTSTGDACVALTNETLRKMYCGW